MSADGTVADVLRQITAALAQADVPDPARDAARLLAHVAGLSPVGLSVSGATPLTEAQHAQAMAMATRRARREPLSHILGYRDFYKHRFAVTADVLDPRPETELLVDLAMSEPFETLLDLGTGSGCIPISLLAARAQAHGLATDISQEALTVAAQNAKTLGLEHRLRLVQADWFDGIDGVFDLITANPPYVTEAAYQTLAPELFFEPRGALTPGGDGLAAYRRIAAEAGQHLCAGGRLLLEIGYDQAEPVTALLQARGFAQVTCHRDLNGHDRVISARCP